MSRMVLMSIPACGICMSVILEGVLDEELNEELGYQNMATETKTPITAEMVILPKPCILHTEIWRWQFLDPKWEI